MPTFSHSLEGSLTRALNLASERYHKYATLEHLLLALIEDPDASAVMRSCNVDFDKFRRELLASIESDPENAAVHQSEPANPTSSFQRVIQRAVIHAQSVNKQTLTGVDVLIAVFRESESHAVRILREHHVTRYDATRYVSHGRFKSDHVADRADDARPPSFPDNPTELSANVLLLNDDYTPMEFVVYVLESIFDMDHETATRIMLQIHNEGTGTCGIYPYDAAKVKVREVLDFARSHQHPLQCVMEPREFAVTTAPRTL
jgi:ATP-dependent Clp protease adapter protein ClpS